jgi:type IV pilus assembly protein PilQ
MRKWTSTAGAIFMAAAAVYTGQALLVKPASAANAASSGNSSAQAASTPASPFRPQTSAASAQPTGENFFKNAPATSPATAPAANANGSDATAVATSGDSSAAPATAPSTQPGDGTATGDGGGEGTSVSSTDVNVNDTGAVEIHVNDANLVEVLRMLSLQSQKNIIASKEVGGKVTANLYGVTVREALDAILSANGYGYKEKGNFIYVYTEKELQEKEKAERKMVTEVFHLHYTPAANVQTMIKPILSEGAALAFSTAAASGIDSGVKDVGGNSHSTDDVMVITDFPENLDRIRAVIKEVDKRPQQILIEATILRAALNEDNALGVDFTVLGGIRFDEMIGTPAETRVAAPNGALQSPSDPKVGTAGYTAVNTGFTNNVPSGGLKIGYVQNNIAVFLSALEQVTDTTIVANPKVLALNKQRGEVIVGRKDGYKTTTVTENVAVESVEFLDTGTRLVFRPYIADDGYIRMEIHPEDSSGGLTTANLPFKITTEVTSNVMIKDGHTIVIGGLFRESSTSSKSQVPFLGNIPLLGTLFKSQRDQTVREEIIILLTPHIIKDDATYSKLSEEQQKEADKLRTGVRRGMMPWGRERLAESDYEHALADLNKAKPDRKSALWHLDSAINLNPQFSEAIDLKQELTGKEVSSADNSSIRNFVRRVMMAERFDAEATTQPSDDVLTPTPMTPMTPTTRPAMNENSDSTALEGPAVQPVSETAPLVAIAPPATEPTTRPAVAKSGTRHQPFTYGSCDDCDDAMAIDKEDQQPSNQQDMTAAPTDEVTPNAGEDQPSDSSSTGGQDPDDEQR